LNTDTITCIQIHFASRISVWRPVYFLLVHPFDRAPSAETANAWPGGGIMPRHGLPVSPFLTPGA